MSPRPVGSLLFTSRSAVGTCRRRLALMTATKFVNERTRLRGETGGQERARGIRECFRPRGAHVVADHARVALRKVEPACGAVDVIIGARGGRCRLHGAAIVGAFVGPRVGPLRTYPQEVLAESKGFEPLVAFTTPDFESGTFGHSVSSPPRKFVHRGPRVKRCCASAGRRGCRYGRAGGGGGLSTVPGRPTRRVSSPAGITRSPLISSTSRTTSTASFAGS